MFGCVSDGCHNGGRGGKNKGARAEYNKNCYGADDLTGEKPCKNSRHKSNDDNPGGPPVGNSDNLCLSGICRLYKADHSLNRAVFAYPQCFHIKRAVEIDSAA